MGVAGASTGNVERPVHSYETNVELSRQLAGRIAADLAAAIKKQYVATLAVSGGSTPLALFEALSRQSLDWSSVVITQVDERWVEDDHPHSNAHLVKQYLLQNEAAAAKFISLKTAADSPFDAESTSSLKLAPFASGIDVIVLGMGEDGHTASFFPGAYSLDRAMDPDGNQLCVAVRPPSAPHDRMTLSLATLLRARHAYLHIIGPEKWDVLMLADEPGETALLPIRALLYSDALELEIYYANRN